MNDIVIIENKIYEIRGQKVMLDFDLTEMYEVSTGNFNKAVKRNVERFPERFMFQLNKDEFNLIFPNGISSWGGTRKMRKRIEYLEEDVSSDRESYKKQFDDLFTAFAKLSATIQIKTTPLDRVKIEGFKNK